MGTAKKDTSKAAPEALAPDTTDSDSASEISTLPDEAYQALREQIKAELYDEIEAEVRAKIEAEANEPELEEEEIEPELLAEMHSAYNYWHMHGSPEKAAVLYECIQQKRRPPYNLLPVSRTGIRPETTVDPSNLTIPPRHGPGASTERWQEFAVAVLDMEEEIIVNLDRSDLIQILEDKGVIPKVKSESTA